MTRTLPPAEMGPVLARARRACGLSLRQAAVRAGTGSFSYIRQLERGERSPSTAMAELLVEGYGLGAEDAAVVRAAAVPDVGRASPFRRR